jgi:hypothetical protein
VQINTSLISNRQYWWGAISTFYFTHLVYIYYYINSIARNICAGELLECQQKDKD